MTSRQVLHVDDDASVRRLVKRVLVSHGYDVTSLGNPREALNTIAKGNQRVIVLDIDMPGVNGLDLLRKIKAHDGGIQVLMLTSLVTQTSVMEAMRLGAVDCLFKTAHDMKGLDLAVERAFENIQLWKDRLLELALLRQNKRVPRKHR